MSRPLGIEYEPSTNCVYIAVKPGRVVRTQSIRDMVNIDYAADGTIIGVEVLGQSA